MERGQASLEYVAVAGVVACLLALAGAAAGAERIPRAVAAQVERALCLVASGDCPREGAPRPCVRASDARTREQRAAALVFRLTDGRTVLQQQLSDGTVAVTVSDTVAGEGGPRTSLKGVRLGAWVGGRMTAGRRWVVTDAAAARALVARLQRGRLPAGEAARGVARFLLGGGGEDERFAELGTRVEATALLSVLKLRVDGRALAGITEGVRVAPGTGRRTLVLRLARTQVAALTTPLGRAAGGAERDVAVEVTFSRGGQPLELLVRRTAEIDGEADVGGFRARGGNLVEAEARLDLADPQLRRLATRLLAEPSVALAGAVGRRLADSARIDVRLYATDRDEWRVAGGQKFGVGLETVERSERARLVLAAGREPGHGWARRLDCKLAAA